MIVTINKFYKVLVIAVDFFESRIIDEKHFSSKAEAEAFESTLKDSNYITIIAEV